MDNWIPVREQLPDEMNPKEYHWVQVQTQDGTVFPAQYVRGQWMPLFRGGLVDQLMHGKVAYWMPHEQGYPYVQCKCGKFYLQAEGRKTCPVCASFGIVEAEKPKKPRAKKEEPKVEELPFTEELSEDMLI